MVGVRAVALWAAAALSQPGSALRARTSRADLTTYSFAEFSKEFGRSYAVGSDEYHHRLALFQASVARVHAVNERNQREGRPWTAGIHPFMDWSEKEREVLNGYKPRRGHRGGKLPPIATLQTRVTETSRTAQQTRLNATMGMRSFNSGPPVRQQGDCGSCWAISAVEAVEAQLLATGVTSQISPQALIDCVPNPEHCGGKGGCDGATAELAYTFMRDYGIPLESTLPYDESTNPCPVPLTGPWPAGQRVRVSGWSSLPSNQVEPLMQAITSQGPVAVAVDGSNWFDYNGGIFDGCDKDATLGHGVLAKGYGEENGRKYWYIQNSWGRGWGEHGHIRMLRHDDEDSWCGTDRKPQDGVGCDGGPSEITVCGMCGLLYDPVIPQGVRVEGDAATSQFTSTASENPYVSTLSSDEKPKQPATPAAPAFDAKATMAADAAAMDSDSPTTGATASTGSKPEDQMDDILKNLRASA